MRALLAVVMLATLALTPAGSAGQDPPDRTYRAAFDYLSALYGFDFEALSALLAPDALFRDPTAVALVGRRLRHEGRDAILDSFRAGAVDTRDAGFDIESHFVAGSVVVLTMTYRSELRGDRVGRPGEWLPVRVRGVTVLHVVDGLVVEHVDHIDYRELLRQIGHAGALDP